MINIEKVASVASAMFAADMNTGAPASRSKCQTLALAELDSLILCRLGKVPCASRDVCRILGIPHCHFSQWSHLVILFKLAVLRYYELGCTRAEIQQRLRVLRTPGRFYPLYADAYTTAASLAHDVL